MGRFTAEGAPVKDWTRAHYAMRPKFAVDSRVMAFHDPLIYEGKVVKYEDRSAQADDVHWYQIHYLGWSKKWDEWVPEKFVMEFNDESVGKQAELHAKYQEERNPDK